MNRSIQLAWTAMSAVAVLGAAACGSDDSGDAGAEAADSTRVEVADTSLGEILVDGEGRTLYLFTEDSPGESVCEGNCLDAWPVFEGEPDAGDGVDADLLGSIERADGTVQATYGDWPLYYYAADAAADAAGDVEGQGVNDVWFVVDATGHAVEQAPDDTGGGSAY